MSNWYWRVVAMKAAFLITCFASYLSADDTVQKLPFCNPDAANDASIANDLVIVSTLDGRLSAFSTSNGIKVWDVETQPLLSSNLHHVELSSGGKWVRLVPSLRGTLYSLSGDSVEPLPLDAEQLLSSSFKYSDDMVIAGARETSWLGIDATTGAVVYTCGSGGCSGEQSATRTLLVLRRHSSTVRALHPATGSEKWNFSVGEHHLALNGGPECAGSPAPLEVDYSIRVALPEGMLAVGPQDSPSDLWQQKLEAPVAAMWRLRSGSLQSIDVLWAATQSLSSETYVQTTPPSLYIGLHNRQLYIQEGLEYMQKMETAVSAQPLPWRLKNSRPLLDGPAGNTALQNSHPDTLSLITLYGNAGQGADHGFFLYHEETCEQSVQTDDDMDGPDTIIIDEQDRDHHHVHVHVYSLWFWWKEVLLIAISSALLLNLMIWPRFFAPRFRPPSPPQINQEYIVVERHYSRTPPSTPQEYSGRYESDFTPLRCLGRGGFGVVFEARNNIDHCCYAVKRITLPRRESKRERVLREVRALAKLEHEHIVRYFNAWLEEPPPNWQQQRDAVWMRELDGVSVAMTEEFSPTQSPRKPPLKAGSVMLNMQKCDPAVDALDYEGQLSEPSKRLRSLSCNDSFSIVFDENASKHNDTSTLSKNSLKKSLNITSELSTPAGLNLAKNLASGDNNDDSFIVFANSEDLNQNSKGLSEARGLDGSFNKRLEKVKQCDDFIKTEKDCSKRKKKGHTRHWSLDLCVKSITEDAKGNVGSKMYLYIQMQLCLRDSLHDWLRNNRTHEARGDKVKTLFSQIVSAVEYVHLAGLIHRDLKPSNIFFAPDGKVKVGDFGLVTAMSDSSQDGEEPADDFHADTRHTYRVGTHLYMSPEQLRGRPYSYKVDIYSLGLILFELLQPFGTEAERVGCLLALREGRYPPAFRKHYDHEMEVLKLMLSEDPSRRPTAAGVKARAPLFQDTDTRWHFSLPNGQTTSSS